MKHINSKRPYVKPSMLVYPLHCSHRLLVGSETIPIGPGNTPNQW
jgi:hypothetical protein